MCFDILSQAGSWIGNAASDAWNGLSDSVGNAFDLSNVEGLSGVDNTWGNSISQGTGEAAQGGGSFNPGFDPGTGFGADPLSIGVNTTAPVSAAVGGTAGPGFAGSAGSDGLATTDPYYSGNSEVAGGYIVPPAYEPPPDQSGWQSIWNGIKGGAGDISSFMKGNGWIIPAAGLGYSLLKDNSVNAVPGYGQLSSNAAAMRDVGNQLLQPLLKGGPLPAGADNPIDRAIGANEAKIRQQYAGMGLSGSTMEAQALQANKAEGASQKSQMATSLAQAGLSALGGSSGQYTNLVNAQLANDKALQEAVSKFAVALAGGNQRYALQPTQFAVPTAVGG